MSASRPGLSIVIAAIDPGEVIFSCLAAIDRQRDADTEVILVDASNDDTAVRVRDRFPWVTTLAAPHRALPRLRGIGMAAARGDRIAVLDAWCLVADGWIAEAKRVHDRGPAAAAGGAVELARRGVAAWATYLFDYWEFVPPVAEGFTRVLSGNNIVYRRDVLPDGETLRAHGFWKAFTNARLAAAGQRLWSSPRLTVRIDRRLPVGRFLRTRYHHGRSYAAMRVEGSAWRTKARWALITPGLPVLFLARQLRGLAGKGMARAWFVLCLPLELAFHVSWAWGELCGYLAGAGRSHDAIRS